MIGGQLLLLYSVAALFMMSDQPLSQIKSILTNSTPAPSKNSITSSKSNK